MCEHTAHRVNDGLIKGRIIGRWESCTNVLRHVRQPGTMFTWCGLDLLSVSVQTVEHRIHSSCHGCKTQLDNAAPAAFDAILRRSLL